MFSIDYMCTKNVDYGIVPACSTEVCLKKSIHIYDHTFLSKSITQEIVRWTDNSIEYDIDYYLSLNLIMYSLFLWTWETFACNVHTIHHNRT